MDSYQFYKSLYDRELNRRKDLDAAINLPLTLLSIIVAANAYLTKESDWIPGSTQTTINLTIMILTAIVLGISIFYLVRSYNNLFRGFAYRNLGLSVQIRKYENDLQVYNQKVDEGEKVMFENIIIDKLTSLIDDHILYNDKRGNDLYAAKAFLIICIILTVINFMNFSLKYLNI
jgi:hypothetical protein